MYHTQSISQLSSHQSISQPSLVVVGGSRVACLTVATVMFLVFNFQQFRHGPAVHSDECIFQRHPPSTAIFILYGLAVPVLAAFGLCTNFINAVVFMRPKMTPSAFSYLAALSWLDCVSCTLITLTALSRSFFYDIPSWIGYDYQWQVPLFSISTGAANLILACVSLDRFLYLYRFKANNGAPKFCRRKVARYMIFVVIIISIAVNMPYFFVFYVDPITGVCHVTEFYYSTFYQIHNWFTFTLLAICPAIFLLIGNTAIILAFRRWTKQGKACRQACSNANAQTTNKRYQHQMKLTISIVIVITLYMIGELPAHMTSRKSSLNLLFGGDADKVNTQLMEKLEVICITLNALQLSMNIVVYAVINPSFMPEFFVCLRGASDVCFSLCCIPAIRRSWHRCWSRRRQEPRAEERVVSSITPQPLPADEPHQCGCESWSSDSECQNGKHCRAIVGTFAFVDDEEQEPQQPHRDPEIFTTKASGCVQLKEPPTDETAPDEDSLFHSSFIMIN
ncbi:uncharacterized protein Dwil_GK22033 [Drosophila willistoni]|uniref:GK22033 n=1 Tax=Drosophila willistoni TaxID=7260 RepID=B4MR98_DROWI|nr:uncharacterized protein LOC6640486 [Drosophila willistoni]EDW74637.1 uncharacterized protein Dwil_GK22033 [Drosophila willistoni]